MLFCCFQCLHSFNNFLFVFRQGRTKTETHRQTIPNHFVVFPSRATKLLCTTLDGKCVFVYAPQTKDKNFRLVTFRHLSDIIWANRTQDFAFGNTSEVRGKNIFSFVFVVQVIRTENILVQNICYEISFQAP